MDKRALLDEVLTQLQREHETLQGAQRAAQDAATHEENRAESDKDMRSTEASYLARGQAERVAALERDLLLLQNVQIGTFGGDDGIVASALVTLDSPRGRTRVFLLPAGGGTRIERDGKQISVVTTSSPLGSALIGCSRGDTIEVERGDDVIEYSVVGVE